MLYYPQQYEPIHFYISQIIIHFLDLNSTWSIPIINPIEVKKTASLLQFFFIHKMEGIDIRILL